MNVKFNGGGTFMFLNTFGDLSKTRRVWAKPFFSAKSSCGKRKTWECNQQIMRHWATNLDICLSIQHYQAATCRLPELVGGMANARQNWMVLFEKQPATCSSSGTVFEVKVATYYHDWIMLEFSGVILWLFLADLSPGRTGARFWYTCTSSQFCLYFFSKCSVWRLAFVTFVIYH